MQQLNPEPIWDEGISSYLYGEFERKQAPLSTEELRVSAIEQAVRIGDILETLFLMAIYGEWKYTDESGQEQTLDEDALNELYGKGRISEEELKAFPGFWSPVE